MPEKVDKIKLPEHLDRRIKLSLETKEIIKQEYLTGLYSLNTLAAKYKVSKKSILLIVNPISKLKSDARIKEHWKDYSDSEMHKQAIKKTRNYKKDLFKIGLIW